MISIKKSSLALTNGTIDFPMVDIDIFSFTRYFLNAILEFQNFGNFKFNIFPYRLQSSRNEQYRISNCMECR